MKFEQPQFGSQERAAAAPAADPQVEQIEQVYGEANQYLAHNTLRLYDVREYYSDAAFATLSDRVQTLKNYDAEVELRQAHRDARDVESRFGAHNVSLDRAARKAQDKKLSVIQEAAVHYGIAERGWLGSGFRSAMRSELDDQYHGIDIMALADAREEDGSARLDHQVAVDLTLSDREQQQKLEDVVSKLDSAPELLRMRMFADEVTKTGGPLRAPKVAVQMSRDEVTNIAGTWKSRHAEDGAFARHPAQLDLISQALVQSAALAARYEQPRPAFASMYRKNAEHLRRSLEERAGLLGLSPDGSLAIEFASDVLRMPEAELRALICGERDGARPILRRFAWKI